MSTKDTNPKDAIGSRKWRTLCFVPSVVLFELGAALLEGAKKYGPFNWRTAGVRSSIYVDAAIGHILQYWEGEDIDPDSGLSHITKAIASLVVLRDSMIQENHVDDRPPSSDLDAFRDRMQGTVDEIFERYSPKAEIEEDVPSPASAWVDRVEIARLVDADGFTLSTVVRGSRADLDPEE